MKIEDIKTCPICSATLKYEHINTYHLIHDNIIKAACPAYLHFRINNLDNRNITYFLKKDLAFVLNFTNVFHKMDILSLRELNGKWITISECEFPDLSVLYDRNKMEKLAEMLQFYR